MKFFRAPYNFTLLLAATLALAACAHAPAAKNESSSTAAAASATTSAVSTATSSTAASSSAAAAAATSSASSATSAAATIIRVWPDYRVAESFDRISEYFTGAENTGNQIVLRTHPESRAGFYFFTRLKMESPADIAIAGAQVEIGVITPDSPVAKTFLLRVPATLRKGTILLNPGLTGPDWPPTDAKTHPVAWRVRLLSADGAELATSQSYLWSK